MFKTFLFFDFEKRKCFKNFKIILATLSLGYAIYLFTDDYVGMGL